MVKRILDNLLNNKVLNKDIRYRKFTFRFSLLVALLMIVIGIFTDNPANSITFSIYPLNEAIRLSLRPPIIMLSGIVLGPFWGGLVGGTIDVFSYFIYNRHLDYVFILTVLSILRGFSSGYLYNYYFKNFSLKAVVVSLAIPHLIISALFIPMVLFYNFNVPFLSNLTTRLKIIMITTPIYITGIYYMLKGLKKNADLKRTHNQMKEILNIDDLTGLSNRRYFMDFYNKIFTMSKRHDLPLSIIMLDLDNFKNINDNYGHSEGDKYLEKVGDILDLEIRNEDLAARLGGDEFIILLPETKLKEALNLGERILKNVQNITLDSCELNLTVSIGIAELKKEDSIESLLKRVDDAMYKAKEKGKDRVENLCLIS